MSSSDAEPRPESRDAKVGAILGVFFLALALPVLVGTAFAETGIDRTLNVASAFLLAVVGGFFLWRARVAAVRARRQGMAEAPEER